MAKYNANMHYGKGSGYVSGHTTIESARNDLNKMIAYYVDLGYTIHEAVIQEICNTCDGNGKVKKCRHKYGSRCFGYTCYKPCSVCKNNPFTTIETIQ